MKVLMRTTMANPSGVFMAGQVADLPDEQAKKLLDLNYAEPIVEEPVIETANIGGAEENTAARTGVLKPKTGKKK